MATRKRSSFDKDKSEEERRLAAQGRMQVQQPVIEQEQQPVNNGLDSQLAEGLQQIADAAQQQAADRNEQLKQEVRQQFSLTPEQQAAALQRQTEPGTSAAVEAEKAGDTENTDNGVSTAMQQANKDIESATEQAIKDNEKNNQDNRNFLGRLVLGYKEDLDRAEKEAELQRQIDNSKSAFAGVTEFASALVNLLGTTQGAVNQQPKTYAQDWMREADQHRLQERERMDRIRERVRQQEMAGENARYQMTKEQIAERLNLINLKGKGAVAVAQQKEAEDDKAYARAQAEESLQIGQEQFAQTLALNALKEKNRHQEQMAKAGVTGVKSGKNGDYTVTYKKDYKSGSGSGSGKNNIYTIPKAGDMPEMRHHVPIEMVNQLVYDYIEAGSVDDLDEKGMEILSKLKPEKEMNIPGLSQNAEKVSEKAEKYRALVAHSQVLRSAVAKLEQELLKLQEEDTDDEDTDENPAVDKDGFPNTL